MLNESNPNKKIAKIGLVLVLVLCLITSCGPKPKPAEKVKPSITAPRTETLSEKDIPQLKDRVEKSSPPQIQSEPKFNTLKALEHIRYLSTTIGPRREGTEREKLAADYIKSEFQKMGYMTKIQLFPLPNGSVSQNIIARKEGMVSDNRLVIGAHYDTKSNTPGANDNASGAGVMLELARAVRDHPLTCSIDFVAFGAEEMIDRNIDHHHYGSRHFVNFLSPTERGQIVGMISIDMVGVGSDFKVGTMRLESPIIANLITSQAQILGYKASYFKSKGLSDHEPFEKKGIPSAIVEWGKDPYYHTPKDTFDRIKSENIEITGKTLLEFLLNLDESKLVTLLQWFTPVCRQAGFTVHGSQ